MLHAAAPTFGPFFALRFLLGKLVWFDSFKFSVDNAIGMCESCVAPILIILISMFYKKDEQVSTKHIPPVKQFLKNMF